MGNWFTKTEYVDNRATLERLKRQESQLKELRQLVAALTVGPKRRKDLEFCEEEQRRIFETLLSSLRSMTFVSPMPKELQHARHVLVIGDVSVGKTALINRLFDLHLPVALGHCTKEISAVFNDGRTIVWDTPGGNQDFAFYDPRALHFIHSATLVVILYKSSVSTLDDNVLKVVDAIKPSRFACVRTQCDLYDQRTIDQEMQRDREWLESRGLTAVVYRTAARGEKEFDNAAVKRMLLGE